MNDKELKLCPFRSAAFLIHFGQSPQPHHDRSMRFTACDPKCQFYVDSAYGQHCKPIILMGQLADALGRCVQQTEKVGDLKKQSKV